VICRVKLDEEKSNDAGLAQEHMVLAPYNCTPCGGLVNGVATLLPAEESVLNVI
jgi:hypothetical protein